MTAPIKLRRTDFYSDDWLAGTVELTLEEEGAFIRICALIYSKGRPIPDDDRWLSSMFRVSTRKWQTLRQALIEKEKITISDGLIHQERCRKELEKGANIARKRAESGAKGRRKLAEQSAKALTDNDTGQASGQANTHARATPSPSPSPSPTTSKKNGDYAFDGVVIRLNWRDFTRWAEAYQAIPDLRALLQSRDDWLASIPEDERRNWFISTSNYLAKQNTRALAERAASQDDEYDPDFIN